MKRLRLMILTVLHFCVDLSCIYYLLACAAVTVPDHETWLFFAVLYNFTAFGMPLCIGVLADLRDRSLSFAAAGCLLVCGGFLCRFSLPLSVILLGTGNGLFHIGGGRRILLDDKTHYAPGGIFISAGALGVYLGRYWGGQHLVISDIFEILMLICAALLIVMCLYDRKHSDDPISADNVSSSALNKMPTVNNDRRPPIGSGSERLEKTILISLFLLFAVIFLRSLYGSLTVYSWNSGFVTGLIFTICIAAGKFSGGIVADLIGLKRTIAFSLLIAGIIAVFSFVSPVCGMISILCFNMTMPISLSLLDRLLPDMPGSAFGILMMALFLGTLPGMLGNISLLSTPIGLAAMCVISLIILWIAAVRMERKGARL